MNFNIIHIWQCFLSNHLEQKWVGCEQKSWDLKPEFDWGIVESDYYVKLHSRLGNPYLHVKLIKMDGVIRNSIVSLHHLDLKTGEKQMIGEKIEGKLEQVIAQMAQQIKDV